MYSPGSIYWARNTQELDSDLGFDRQMSKGPCPYARVFFGFWIFVRARGCARNIGVRYRGVQKSIHDLIWFYELYIRSFINVSESLQSLDVYGVAKISRLPTSEDCFYYCS